MWIPLLRGQGILMPAAPGSLRSSEPAAQGDAPGAGFARNAHDEAGVATSGRVQFLEIFLAQCVPDPSVYIPCFAAAEADAEVCQSIAANVRIKRARGVR